MKSVILTPFIAALCWNAISYSPEDYRALLVKPQLTDNIILSFTVPTANFVKDGPIFPTAGVRFTFRGMFVSRDPESGKHSATSTYLPSPGRAIVSKKYDGDYTFLIAFEEPDLYVEFGVSEDGIPKGSAAHTFYRTHGVVLEESALTQIEGVKAV